jgi:hypothetical protein
VSTKIHVLDFLRADEKAFENLKALCADLDVTVLGEAIFLYFQCRVHANPTK